MFIKLLTLFVDYAKSTPLHRMVMQAFVFTFVITWAGILAVLVTNFSTLSDIYQRSVATTDIQVEASLTRSVQTNKILEERRISFGVDRLYVSKFHNGKVDINGVHFIYFSRIAESVTAGISGELVNTQSIPLSIFPKMVAALSMDHCYYVNDVNDSIENSQYLSTMGVGSMMICPIYTPTHQLVGIIGAEGVVNQITPAAADGLEPQLTNLASVMGVLITTQ